MIPASSPSPFGEWLPDLGQFDNEGALVMRNVTTQGDRYKPFGTTLEGSNAIPATCKGGFAYRDAIGNTTIFAGTQTALYKLVGLDWVEVTRLDGAGPDVEPYTMGDEGFWDFLNFGTLIIATDYNDDIQVYDMASSSEFEELSTSAPRCRRFFVLNNFLVCLDVVDGDGATGYRVRWSPEADPRGDWDDLDLQADFQDIYGGDFANSFGAALQDFGVVVQGKSLWRMDYVGPSSGIFAFTPLDVGRGSILGRACIANGRSIFFPSEDGIYECDGSQLLAIGNNKIDKWFYSDFNETYDYNMNVQIDQIKKNVLWAYPSKSAEGGACDKILCFNWVDRRFTEIEQDCDCLFTFMSVGYTLDGLDALYDNIDEMPYSLDSRIWTGGKTILGCVTSDHKLAAFSGPPKVATLGTTLIRPNIDGKSCLHTVMPYIEGGDQRARVFYKQLLNESELSTEFVEQNPYTGEIDILQEGTFFRAEVELSGNWQTAIKVGFRAKATGDA